MVVDYFQSVNIIVDARPNIKIPLILAKFISREYMGNDFNNLTKPENHNKTPATRSTVKTEPVHPFEEDIKVLFSKGFSFDGRKTSLIRKNNITVKSIFTDFETFAICSGLKDKRAKRMANRFFENPGGTHDKIRAHELAMEVKEKYGLDFANYILSLPPLPFQSKNANRIFHTMDKRKNEVSPTIRIIHMNKNNEKEKLMISFFVEKTDGKRKRNNNTLKIRNLTQKKDVMTISRKGFITPSREAPEIKPIVELFTDPSIDMQQLAVYYGLEMGECSVCGRPLTDPDSLRSGIGPVCAKYLI